MNGISVRMGSDLRARSEAKSELEWELVKCTFNPEFLNASSVSIIFWRLGSSNCQEITDIDRLSSYGLSR